MQQWRQAAPDRFIPGLQFQFGRETLSPDSLRRLYQNGRFAAGDALLDPYWAVAEELDIPGGVHIGTGPPGAPYLGCTRDRAALHSALTLEEVLRATSHPAGRYHARRLAHAR
ncbi:MAG: hypothetical protein ACREOF_10550 [Gemmatimonadales bacterium]